MGAAKYDGVRTGVKKRLHAGLHSLLCLRSMSLSSFDKLHESLADVLHHLDVVSPALPGALVLVSLQCAGSG